MAVNIRYTPHGDEFYRTARERVNRYFSEKGISRHADASMYRKTCSLLAIYVALYAMILSNHFTGWGLFFLQIAFHCDTFLIAVGIAHDGSHNAYSSKRSINRAITYVFDLIGINSHFWTYNHLHSHHVAPNVPLIDSAIESFAGIRLHPRTKKTRMSRYQHLYMFFVYSLVPLFQLWLLEFISFRQNVTGYQKGDQHTRHQMVLLYVSKVVVAAYSLIIPLIVVHVPAWQIIAGFLAGHMITGITLGIVFQTTHLCDHSVFPEPDENGLLPNTFSRHIMETTSEFAVNSPVITWICGGLNLHVTHHLFPNICQTHLHTISKIVRQTAREYNMPYKSYTLTQAIASHLRCLRTLGNAPSYETASPQPQPNYQPASMS